MKRSAFILILFMGSCVAAFSQCTPDPLYADSVFGVWPDTATNFPPAVLDDPYFAQVDVIVPANTGDIPGVDLPFDLPIDSAQVLDVVGLPDGLTFDCNSQTPASCTFLPEVLGCGVVIGTPTEVGTFPLVLSLRAWVTFIGSPLEQDQEFTGYQIVVTEEAVGIIENSPIETVGQNAPNPFSERTRIDFRLSESAEIVFSVVNMLGEEVFVQHRIGLAGRNSFSYRPEGLKDGVYLYSITTPEGSVTRRMIVDR